MSGSPKHSDPNSTNTNGAVSTAVKNAATKWLVARGLVSDKAKGLLTPEAVEVLCENLLSALSKSSADQIPDGGYSDAVSPLGVNPIDAQKKRWADLDAKVHAAGVFDGETVLAAEELKSNPAALHLDSLLCHQAAQLFYTTCRPERFDLFEHMSASELFFIEFDSLLVESLCNAHVNWKTVQSLHIIFLAERLLSNLKQRGGNFVVVVFDSNAALWSSSPQFAVMRALLLARLKAVGDTAGFEVKNFPSWWSSVYVEYHQRMTPEFMLVNDAEQFSTFESSLFHSGGAFEFTANNRVASPTAASASDATTTDSTSLLSPEAGVAAVAMFRMYILFTISLRTHIAFTSRLVFKDNGVLAFIIRAYSDRFVPAQAISPFLAATIEKKIVKGALVPTATFSEDDIALIDAIHDKNEKDKLALSTRDLVLIPALIQLLKDTGAEDKMEVLTWVKLHIMTIIVQRNMPLGTRSLVPAAPTSDAAMRSLCTYLDEIAARSLNYITHAQEHICDLDEKICDTMDGVLLSNVAAVAAGSAFSLEKLFGEESAFIVESIWQLCAKKAGLKKAPFNPVSEPSKVNFVLSSKVEAAAKRELVKASLHPLVDSLMNTTNESWPSVAGSQDWSVQRTSGLTEDWDLLGDLTDLDVPPGVKEHEAEAKRIATLTGDARKRAERLSNDFIASVQKIADSMDVKPFLHANELLCIVDNDAKDEKPKSKEEESAEAAAEEKRKQLQARSKPGTSAPGRSEQLRRDNALRLTGQTAQQTFSQCGNIISGMKRTSEFLSADLRMLDDFVDNVKFSADFDDFTQGAVVPVEELHELWDKMLKHAAETTAMKEERDFMFPSEKDQGKKLDLQVSFNIIEKFCKHLQEQAKKNDDSKGKPAKKKTCPSEDAEKISLLLKGVFFSNFKNHIKARALVEGIPIAKKLNNYFKSNLLKNI